MPWWGWLAIGVGLVLAALAAATLGRESLDTFQAAVARDDDDQGRADR